MNPVATDVDTFQQSDGYRSHYRRWGAPRGGDAIVLLHGGMSHSGWQAPLGEALAASSDISLIALDRRGSGLNAGRGHIPDADQVVTDVVEVLRYLKGDFDRVHLAGWCFGGQVACAVAARVSSEQLVSSLLLVAPGFSFNERYSDVLRLSIESAVAAVEEFQLRPEATRAYIKVPLEPGDFTADPRWQAFIDHDDLRLTRVTDGTVLAWDALADLAEKSLPNLGDIPVLAVFGRRDRLVDNARVRQFLTAGRPVTIEELDTGHAVQFEAAQQLAALLTAFATRSR